MPNSKKQGNLSLNKLVVYLKKNKSTTISICALIVSIISLIASQSIAKESNIISKESNIIAIEAGEKADKSVKIQEENQLFQKAKLSQEQTAEAYSDLYQDKENLLIVESLKNDQYVQNELQVRLVIDVFEGLGNSFCQGVVWKYHLNTYIKNTLENICENNQVYQTFANKKNRLAMLCTEFFPNSKFAETLNTSNLDSCNFYDSSINSDNLKSNTSSNKTKTIILRKKN